MNEHVVSRAEPASLRALITARDWTTTPLGPENTWPQSLRTLLRLMLSSRYAMWMGWGPELSFFYNDAYASETLAAKHPWALGRPAREVWAEIWDVVWPRIAQVLSSGEATWDEGLLLFLERSGYPEETYHTFSYSPAPGDDSNAIAGLFCVVIEETERVIGQRRIALLGSLGSLLSKTQTTRDVFDAVEQCLAADSRDMPFSLTYLFDDDGRAERVAQTGFPQMHPAAPRIASDDNLWPFSELRRGAATRELDLNTSRQWPSGPWQRSPSKALVVPIAQQGDDRPAGVFIAGVNPHRPLDKEVRDFVQLFVGQLSAGLSNARAHEQTRKRADALAEIDRAKTAFFSNVSHEFRTPLTLMLAPLEDLRTSQAINPEDKERLELLHRNALRLLKLVNTLLEFSRIEAGRLEAAYQETDLSALTADLASNFRTTVERAGLRFVVDCPPLPEPLYVDRSMWEKIVLNLLSNAFKFTFEGTIGVRVRMLEGAAELEVSDTGIGIAEHELPRLFERFHRIAGSRSRSHEGSGIGLALVGDLVRLQGGQIDVSSTPGKGSTFRIRLRTGKEHLLPEQIRVPETQHTAHELAGAFLEEARRWAGSGSESGEQVLGIAAVKGAPLGRLLVADDNADMRDYLTRLLRERWEVIAVADGRAALEAARRQAPDLVLSDMMMPQLDGFGLLKALRADASTRDIPVVLLSARAGEEATLEALQAGADDYVVKPFSARDLLVRITTRLAAVRAAREASEQRRNVYRHFMQAPFPIVVMRGRQHVFELANASALKTLGKTESIIGKPIREGVPELLGQPFPDLLDQAYDTGTPREGREVPALLPTGPGGSLEGGYFNFVFAPLFDTRGDVEGILACAFDVTSSVRAQREAAIAHAKALKNAEQTNRAKDEFLATMGHELRTPLNAMLGWASLLKSDHRDPAKLQRGLDVIERNAQTQARLVSDLLDVSRIISGKLSMNVRQVELVQVIHAALDVIRPAADAKGVRLLVDIEQPVALVMADPDRLQQVIWNLLSNAVRFTPAEGTVAVSAKREAKTVSVSVEDTGAGIPSEHIPHVFERFRQVDSSITRSHGGLGLGLSIVRHLVEAHGGDVEARSAGPGKGSVFTIHLPIRGQDATPAPPDERLTPSSANGESKSLPRLGPISILVVDDERDSLELLRVVLEGAGARVTTASSSRDALNSSGPFDVIVSDIGMPEMDGYSLIQHLRARPEAAHTPAIALTAYARTEDAARAIDAGFQEHLSKPVDTWHLLQTVNRWTRSAGVDVHE